MNTDIKNIIFDFGGVLLDWDPKNLFKHHFDTKEDLDFFLNSVCNYDWNLKQDAGRTFQDGINELIPQFPQYKKQIELYFSHWIETITGEIKENTKLIELLEPNYQLYGLTNWSAETFPLVYTTYPFFKKLKGIVVSGEEKMIKPNPNFYTILLERYSLLPQESLFIDDNEENIIAASNLGLHTIHLSKNTILEEELKKMNII